MIPVNNESFTLKKYARKENSPYEYETAPCLIFKGRPANQREKKMYRIMQGVNGNNESVYIFCTNLPQSLKPGDRIEFCGKLYTLESTGYYYTNNLLVNNSVMSNEYITKRCPKGIALQ